MARELILLLKFHGLRPVAAIWAERLAAIARRLPDKPELIVPVPLGSQRLRRRGYNQSAEISCRLARQLGCRHCSRALRRCHNTPPQSGLSATARIRNLHGAFLARPDRVAGKRILLVDDVVTTGATVREAALALVRAGAQRVDVLVAARADLRNPAAFDGEAA